LIAVCNAKAQISEGGMPPSFNYTSLLRSEIKTTVLPIPFNVKELINYDNQMAASGNPLRVATSIPVDFTMDNSGQWTVLPGGEKIWRLRVQAEGAIALMLYYKAFDIPEGGKLFIYNADKSHVLGAYTHRTNPRKDYFATEFVAGDDLILEYVAPDNDNAGIPNIEIEGVSYGYNHLSVSPLSAGSCRVNINCSEGSEWQKEKTGICHTIQYIGGSGYICSGSLVNNTAEDFKPYVLMAFHCMEANGKVSTADEMKQWKFYFNFERSGCTDNSQPALSETMTGCTKIASSNIDKGSDGLLVLLDQPVPESYNVYFNGWDRRNTPPLSGVGIHHPEGDYKKISTYTSRAVHTTWGGENSTGLTSGHWGIYFSETENGHSIVEGGSSGSPLFNQDHLIVGTLSGSDARLNCENPGLINLYGKLAYHWDKSTADTARMDIWLDPIGSGTETLRGLPQNGGKPEPTNLRLSYSDKSVSLNWAAPSSSEKPIRYKIYKAKQLIGTTTNTSFTDKNINIWGEIIYGVTAQYADGEESYPLSGSIKIQEFKMPSDLNVKKEADNITLSWNAPFYSQVISWSGADPVNLLSVGVNNPYYFGHYWSVDDLKGLNKNTISAIEFYANKDATYSLLILNGNRSYTQTINTPRNSSIITEDLSTPFEIRETESLFITILTSSTKDVGTMACDDGPAIIGKGNIISRDGKEWFVVYNGEGDDRFNYNFYLGAVVTTPQGTVNRSASLTSTGIQQNLINKSTTFPKVSSLNNATLLRTTAESQNAVTHSEEFQYPSPFPVLTGYKVYRNAELLTPTPITTLSYTDVNPPAGNYVYSITAVYESVNESEKQQSEEIPVSNDMTLTNDVSISPTSFSNYVRITNSEQVTRLEIYSISGALINQFTSPEDVIDTSLLSPGAYIFRLHTKEGIKTFLNIKK
jgi:hypothetical protein